MEKKFLRIISVLCASVIVCTAAQSKKDNSYIFTCPRSLKIGSNNELQFTRFGDLDKETLKIRLYYKENYNSNDTLASEDEYELEKGQKVTTINYSVSPFTTEFVYNGRIQIEGTVGGQKIGGSDDVTFATVKKDIIIIQTDKPLYKPGEEVKWRILKVDSKLKPSQNKNDVGLVYIEDTNGVRLFQSENVPLKDGLYQSQFLLADEPVQGIWRINLKTENDSAMTFFNVQQYVLPKFEVKIKFPPFVLATAEEIPIQICANYTYGKPLQGQLNLNVSLQYYYYFQTKKPVIEESVKLDGCYTYTLNVSLIQLGTTDYYTSIQVFANVIEDGTGVQKNETQYLQRTTVPLNLNFDRNQLGQQYFKPGLPHSGKLLVTNPDNTPAANECIQLTYTVNKQRVIANYLGTQTVKYSKNFTTNSKGIIKYIIPPQNVDAMSIQLEAKSLKYAVDPNMPMPNHILSQPMTYGSLSPFFSPSGSFIQFATVEKPLTCESTADLKFLFTSKDSDDFEFFYEVIRQGKVIVSGTEKVSFTTNDDISDRFKDNKRLIDDTEERIVPPPNSEDTNSSSSSEESCPATVESKYVPPIGEASISLDIDSSISPSFHLLIYYIRDDKEVVADSMTLQVERCFKNKVEFEFSDEVKQPGQNTTVTVSASPNSLCGIKTIDKSVTLLDSSDQLTAESVFQHIGSMDMGSYYGIDPCNTNKPQPGLSSKDISILPPLPYSYSSYQDSLTSFQNTGYLVISNLIVFTRPCTRNEGSYYPTPIPRPFYGKEQALGGLGPAGGFGGISNDLAVDGEITTQSAVDVRQNFPETWLFDLELVGPNGVYSASETLPGTITEWLGSAVCVSAEDGFGISNTTSIRGFQLFFISYTLPVSVIRGEEFYVVVSIFSYADGALPVTVSVDDPQGYQILDGSINGDACIQPGKSESYRLKVKATALGKINITVRAETAKNSDKCGSADVSNAYARDAITQYLEVEAEGFPVETVQGILFCPNDEESKKFETTYSLNLPEDVVSGSARVLVDVTGNILGKSIQNLEHLVSLPTGCGEQNLVRFVPNYIVLDYLTAIGELTDIIKNRAIRNLNTGYQRQLNYRHQDGSFSAFGAVDKTGSMILTAYVARAFVQAQRYITIDKSIVTAAQAWIVDKQLQNGCFPVVGQTVDGSLQGGLEKDKSEIAITAYVLASLLISNYTNQSAIDSALSCLQNNKPITPYEIFLVAYAEALAGDKKDAQKRLDDIKPFVRTEGGVEYYANPNDTSPLQVETNSYAVLTNLKLGNSAQDVLTLVRYLTRNLGATGGFYSTQDTVVGLEALSNFATLVYGEPIDIQVTMTGSLDKTVQIDNGNKFLVQRNRVSKVPGDLNIEATGSGCGLIQASLRYNSNTPPEKNIFYFKVVGQCEGNSKRRKISGTVSYIPSGKATGFGLVQIKMPTGVVPDRESITQLPGNKDFNVLRADVDGNTVNLYFHEINNNGEKFEFEAEEVIEVDNPQPGSALVYEYYAPDNSATTTFSFDCSK